jgi:aspartyl-tRNA(Asn)/glutamyl-tRNA(Gln) amidotransferase subunit A
MANTTYIDFRANDVPSLVKRVRLGEIRAQDLVQHAMERIDALNGKINAFVAIDAEAAFEEAHRIDSLIATDRDPGPLAGMPLAVKDLEDSAGYVTTFGSEVLSSEQPATVDSLLVARLKAAGAIVVGKTNTPELGWKGFTDNPRFGPTRNPWSTRHTPGGSSGGSAAAVASGMVPLATGSDGGGSIRIPSAWCGLTGFKPSLGRIPDGPGVSVGWRELSCKGVLGNKISDILEALIPVSGPDERDFTSLPPIVDWKLARKPKLPRRIAWSPTLGYASIDPDILRVCEDAIQLIARSGVEIEEIPSVFSRDPAKTFHTLVSVYNLRTVAHLQGTSLWRRLDPELAVSVEPAMCLSAIDVVGAEDDCARFNHELVSVFSRFDLLLTPTCATSAPVIGHSALCGKHLDLSPYPLAYPFNLTRSPAASVHAGFDQSGIPVGLQVVGRMYDDIDVIRATAALEAILAVRSLPSETSPLPLSEHQLTSSPSL